MENNESVEFLREAKSELHRLIESKKNHASAEEETKKLEKTLRKEQKAVNDSVKAAVKKSLGEVTAACDAELKKAGDALSQEKNAREKSAAEQKKERIKAATADLHEEVRLTNEKAKELFRNSEMPMICNTDLFYSLFDPKGIKDYLELVLAAALCFLLLPFVITRLVPSKGTVVTILIFVLCIVIFGGLYIFLNEKTKMSHPEEVQVGRRYRGAIGAAKAKIREIEESIEKDTDESMYDLAAFDEEIVRKQAELDAVTQQKTAALDEFEQVTRKNIAEEIKGASQEKLDTLAKDLENAKAACAAADESVREQELAFQETYGARLDKNLLQEQKLDRLIEIIENGEAATLEEAVNVYKAK